MKTVLNINIDKQLKDDFTAFAKDLGTNPTALLNMMIVETLRERRVSFGRGAGFVEEPEWVETFSKISGEKRDNFILG